MNDFLLHYGIKGQRWGVRRFQNEDGTYTNEGKRRYGIEDESKKTEKADVEAQQRERVKTFLKIVGAVTLAAAVAYGGYKAHKFLSPLMNKSIKSGSTIKRITVGPNDSFNRPFYASDNIKDATKYKGMLARERLRAIKNKNHDFYHNPIKVKEGTGYKFYGRQGPPVKESVYELSGKAQGKIKIAGDRAGKKAYESLMKNDPDFRKAVETAQMTTRTVPANLKGNPDSPMNRYKFFNRDLVNHNDRQQVLSDKFFAELKKRGFGGVVDVNDRDWTVYKSRAKIIFDTDKIRKTGISELTKESLESYHNKASKILSNENHRRTLFSKVSKWLKGVAVGGASVTGVLGASVALETKRKDSLMVLEYKKEHPGTQKSDRDILKMLKENRS